MSRRQSPHGTNARRCAGCTCSPCREAKRIYAKRQRQGRLQPGFVDPCGTIRRVRGLIAIGWTAKQLGGQLGVGCQWVSRLTMDIERRRGLTVATAAAIRDLCDRVGRDTPPTGMMAERSRSRAARNGWVPLHAWDDIDDPDAEPDLGGDGRDIVDEVAIRRVIDGHARYGDLSLLERKTLVRTYAHRIPNLAQRVGMSGGQLRRWVAEFEAAA